MTEVCFKWSIWQCVCIGLGNGLARNRQQAIMWTMMAHFNIWIKIFEEYQDLLPRTWLVCQEPGLRLIGRDVLTFPCRPVFHQWKCFRLQCAFLALMISVCETSLLPERHQKVRRLKRQSYWWENCMLTCFIDSCWHKLLCQSWWMWLWRVKSKYQGCGWLKVAGNHSDCLFITGTKDCQI